LNQQTGQLLTRFACLLSHFSNLHADFGVFRKQIDQLLSHFSSLRTHLSVFRQQNSQSLTHFAYSPSHFRNSRIDEFHRKVDAANQVERSHFF
jgi:hypothetical protein